MEARRQAVGRWARGQAQVGWTRFYRQPLPLMALELAVVVGLMALLYLSQVAALTSTHQALLAQQARQEQLRRQDAEAHAQLGQVESPAYIDQRARALGLQPAAPGSAVWVTVGGH